MNKTMKKYLFAGCSLALAALVGCGGVTPSLNADGYVYQKESEEMVLFKSSNEALDFFLNDYTKRHSGWVEENGLDQRVNSVVAGKDAKQFFWQEWMSLSYYWFNSFDAYGEDRIAGLRKMLSGVPVDEYGYVWQETDSVRNALSTLSSGEHRMGWPFPTSANSGGSSQSWDFNGNDRSVWDSNIGAEEQSGVFKGIVEQPMEKIVFTSPMPKNLSEEITAYHTPLLEIDLRMYTKDADKIDDILVWYTTADSPEWSEEKCVSVNEKAFISYDYTTMYEHMIFLPMYAEEGWGSDINLTEYIRQIRIEIVAKEGESLTGQFGLSYVRCAYDTRHVDNNSLLISSLRQDYDYTGDLEYLASQITRARKAMNFYMQMYDPIRHLNDQRYLTGHDSDKTSSYKHDITAMSLGNGYWDITFMPEFDFHTNTYFYKALVDLAYLEGILEANNIVVDKADATVRTANRQYDHTPSEYRWTKEELSSIADAVLTELRKPINNANKTGFWSEETGRFVAGYASAEDKWYDYGYVMWNLEAIYYGVATEAQTQSIMDWISGKRIVEMDKNGSQGSDIYYFEFAPRVSTYCAEDKYDLSMLTGMHSLHTTWEYGVSQVQHGGAIMYVSFFDLMSRMEAYGADDAFERLLGIQEWYQEVYDWYVQSENYNKKPDRFYWDYYCQPPWQ